MRKVQERKRDESILTNDTYKSIKHFIENGAKTPPIHATVICFTLEDFGRQIFGRAAECVCSRFTGSKALFAQSKISEDNVSTVIEQNVFRFQVPVHDSL